MAKRNGKKGRMAKFKSRTRRATSVRGGFVPSSVANNIRNYATWKIRQGLTNSGVAPVASGWLAAKAVDMASDGIRGVGSKFGAFTFHHPKTELQAAARTEPGSETTTVKTLTGINNTYKSKMYKTKLEFGRKPGRAVRMLAQANGTVKRVLYASDSQNTSNSTLATLNISFGFNQKQWKFPMNESFPKMGDSFSFFKDQGLNLGPDQSANKDYRLYGMVLKEKITYKIYNSNIYYPIVCKMHLASPDRALAPGTLLNQITNSTVSIQEDQAIPQNFQFGLVDPSTSLDVLVHPKCKLTNSAAFRNDVTVNKTVSEKIFPGDIWEVTVIRHVGPGWDLLQNEYIRQNVTNGGAVPISWFPIWEFHGVDCEAVKNADNRRIIGKSAGDGIIDVHAEYEIINQNFELEGQDISGIVPKFMVRSFSKRLQTSTDTLFNVDRNNVGPGPGIGEIYIPVISDKGIEYSGSTVS